MRKVYAFKNTFEQLMKSSSGGAYIALCETFEKILGKGNVIFYGAMYDKNLNVIHGRKCSAEECAVFQGSKYVKSDISKIFDFLEEDLSEGKYVLFSGTPCQIFAIKKFLENRKVPLDNLYCIDIICHGTPNEKIWNSFKQWLEKNENSKLIQYSFRYKPEGWKAYPAFAEFQNGKKKINTADLSIYSKLQMLGLITNKGCFSCPYSNMNRVGDITIGDYWGIEKIMPTLKSKNGVSLVIINTEKGNSIVDKFDDNKYFLEETKTDEYINYQHNLKEQTQGPERYNEFWKDYQEFGFDFILKKYLNYGKKYIITHKIKRIIRKSPIINIYRNLKK